MLWSSSLARQAGGNSLSGNGDRDHAVEPFLPLYIVRGARGAKSSFIQQSFNLRPPNRRTNERTFVPSIAPATRNRHPTDRPCRGRYRGRRPRPPLTLTAAVMPNARRPRNRNGRTDGRTAADEFRRDRRTFFGVPLCLVVLIWLSLHEGTPDTVQ